MSKNGKKETDLSNSRLDYTLDVEIHEISLDKIRFTGDFNVGFIDKIMQCNDVNLDFSHSEDFNFFEGFYESSSTGARVYFSYNLSRAKATSSRNTWVEWNPNNFPYEELKTLQDVLFGYMNNVHITRVDLAFDIEDDLSNYELFKGRPIEHRSFYSNDSKLETRYIGSPNSGRHVKIYNKKLELMKRNIYINEEVLWRLEVTLKSAKIYDLNKALDNIDIYYPSYESLKTVQETAMLHYLLSDDNNWAKLDPRTRTRYRKIIKETQDFNLTETLRLKLSEQKNRLIDEMNLFLILFNNSRKITLQPLS